MKINKAQKIVLLVGIVLIQLFYFGFDTVQLEDDQTEIIAESSTSGIDLEHEIEDELSHLTGEDRDSVEVWMAEIDHLWNKKQLASFWSAKGKWILAGYYTELIAVSQPSKENYEVAANTYATALTEQNQPAMRTYLQNKALTLYDKAIELSDDPYFLSLNKALLIINHPMETGPMAGIQSLMQLSEQYPDRPQAYFHLGRLAIQTNQWDKAKERLEKAYQLNSNDQSTICLLAQVYTQLQDNINQQKFAERCNQ